MKPTGEGRTVLLVDDDAAVRTVLSAILGQVGLDVVEAANGREALETLASGAVDVMVTDLRMPTMDGMELLKQSVATWPDVPVIVLTAYGSVPGAVDAMRLGATDFLEKAGDRADVVAVIQRALEKSARISQPPAAPPDGAEVIVGESLNELRKVMALAAAGTAKVLIRGENGTGKELVARGIHDASSRAGGPFIAVNCAGIPETLFESEMFGFMKGAFTGASKDTPGYVELADGGTLFLDEVGEYSQAVQVKLLRVLQESKITRLGARKPIDVDVRFVFATNKDLEASMRRGEFREDLYFRLNVISIRVPPLRERPSDVGPLTRHFVARSARANGRGALDIALSALELLAGQPWPGNVRQLENFVERLVVFSDGPKITLAHVERQLANDAAPFSSAAAASSPRPEESGLSEARREAERRRIIEALRGAGNKRAFAARMLNVSRRTLYNKLEDYGLLHYPFADQARTTLIEVGDR